MTADKDAFSVSKHSFNYNGIEKNSAPTVIQKSNKAVSKPSKKKKSS
jgi:hypothetical protein